MPMSLSESRTPVFPAGIHFMLDRAPLFFVVGFWHSVFYVTQSSSALDQPIETGPPLADFFISAFSPAKPGCALLPASRVMSGVTCLLSRSCPGGVQLHHPISQRVYQVSPWYRTLDPAWARSRKLHPGRKQKGMTGAGV